MNELLHRRAAETQAWEKNRQALLSEVHQLTPEKARALEDEVKASPKDREKLLKLVRYFQYKVDTRRLIGLTLWYIEHQPEEPWPCSSTISGTGRLGWQPGAIACGRLATTATAPRKRSARSQSIR